MSEIPLATDQSGSEEPEIPSNDHDDSTCNDVITFSTGRIAKLLHRTPSTVYKRMDRKEIPFFHLPESKDRRCTRNDLQCYIDKKGIDANLRTLSQELLNERVRILGLEKASVENIAALLQVAQQTVRKWMDELGLPFIKIASQRRVLWLNLVCFLQDQDVPRELLYEYLPSDAEGNDVRMKSQAMSSPDNGSSGVQPKKLPKWYSPSNVLGLFARYLCDGNREHAQRKLNILLETGGLRYKVDVAASKRISGPDVVAYLKRQGVDITALPSG